MYSFLSRAGAQIPTLPPACHGPIARCEAALDTHCSTAPPQPQTPPTPPRWSHSPPLPYAGHRLAHLAGRRRLLTPVGSEGSGAMRSSHAGTSSSIWVAQACSLRQVAPTQRYPGPYRQHQQPHIALTPPRIGGTWPCRHHEWFGVGRGQGCCLASPHSGGTGA